MEATITPEWTLTDRLAKARHTAKLSQSELGRRLGLSLSTITRYETGSAEPKLAVILAWAMACGVSTSWLLGLDAAPDTEAVTKGYLAA